jgi:hypothetical protein
MIYKLLNLVLAIHIFYRFEYVVHDIPCLALISFRIRHRITYMCVPEANE